MPVIHTGPGGFPVLIQSSLFPPAARYGKPAVPVFLESPSREDRAMARRARGPGSLIERLAGAVRVPPLQYFDFHVFVQLNDAYFIDARAGEPLRPW